MTDKELIEKLKLENQEKENKRWRVKRNDSYFYINDYGEVDSSHETNTEVDNYRYKTRNYFKTEEEAEEYQEIMNTYYDLMDLAEELNNGEKIDWKDEDQYKYSIMYNYDYYDLITFTAFTCKHLGIIYCLDVEFLTKAIEKIGKDKLTKLFKYERN